MADVDSLTTAEVSGDWAGPEMVLLKLADSGRAAVVCESLTLAVDESSGVELLQRLVWIIMS